MIFWSAFLMSLYFYLQMLWEYKRTFAKDQKFEKAVQERFCVADLKLVIIIMKIISCYKLSWSPCYLTGQSGEKDFYYL